MVKTSLGQVKKISSQAQVPQGWRLMKLEQEKRIPDELAQLIGELEVIGFQDGQLDGAGHGRKFGNKRGVHCSEVFIIQNSSMTEIKFKIKTSLGTVGRIGIKDKVPYGWRLLRLDEGKKIAGELDKLVDKWGVVGFQTGKLDGANYGRKISETRGPECGELFIIAL